MRRMQTYRGALIVAALLLTLTAGFAAAQITTIGTQGAYPDIQLDKVGNLHLVYGRLGKTYYRMLPKFGSVFTKEESTGCGASTDHRMQPDVATDSKGNVYALGGAYFNKRTASGWGKAYLPGISRDHHMTVDASDNVWVVYRGYQLSVKMKPAASSAFGSPTHVHTNGGTDHVYPDITAGSDGSVHVVYRMRQPSNYDCGYVRYDPNTKKWTSVEWACLKGSAKVEEGPHIALDRNGTPWVAIPEGALRLNHRSAGTWSTPAVVGSAHTRDEPTIGVDSHGNKFIGKWGGTVYIYNAASAKWTTTRLPSITKQAIGFVDVVGDQTGAWMVYEESSTVNKSVGARSADLVVVRVLPDGKIVAPGSVTGGPPLSVNTGTISAKVGGTIEYGLAAGTKYATKGYILLGGFSGTAPGTPLNNNVVLPLNIDNFSYLVYVLSNTTTFDQFLGFLDASGNGKAFLRAKAGELTPLVGLKMYYAYTTLPGADFASNAVTIPVMP